MYISGISWFPSIKIIHCRRCRSVGSMWMSSFVTPKTEPATPMPRALLPAFNVWKEMLQADQVTFESERISRHVCKKGMISIWPRRRQLIDHHTSESHLFAINYFFLKVGHACSPESEPRLCLCGAIEIGSSCAAKEWNGVCQAAIQIGWTAWGVKQGGGTQIWNWQKKTIGQIQFGCWTYHSESRGFNDVINMISNSRMGI